MVPFKHRCDLCEQQAPQRSGHHQEPRRNEVDGDKRQVFINHTAATDQYRAIHVLALLTVPVMLTPLAEQTLGM
jgi:hypothetical protein